MFLTDSHLLDLSWFLALNSYSHRSWNMHVSLLGLALTARDRRCDLFWPRLAETTCTQFGQRSEPVILLLISVLLYQQRASTHTPRAVVKTSELVSQHHIKPDK